MSEDNERFDVSPDVGSHFAWLRTRLSLERTLMSWMRTSTALIGFGFTIFQFLDRFRDASGTMPFGRVWSPWFFSLALIGSGIAALCISLWQYRLMVRYVWSEQFQKIAGITAERWRTPVEAVAMVLIAVGLFAFLMVLLRVQ